MKTKRLNAILDRMETEGFSQLIISDPTSIFYLTKQWIHPGERMLVLLLDKERGHKLFVSALFPISEDIGAEKIYYKDTDKYLDQLAKSIVDEGKLGVDKNWESKFLLPLMKKKPNLEVHDGSYIVDEVRQIKTQEEIELMREASRINDKAIGRMIELAKTRISEKEMAAELSKIYIDLGTTEGFAFDPIIGYGADAANPHHTTNDNKPNDKDCVLIDMGCVKNSYCSDMTRTVFLGEPTEKQKEVYNIVREAMEKGIQTVRPGVTFKDIDDATRNYIAEKGYGEYFTHRTGHHIGVETHEYGDVSATNTAILKPGMIFSIEPGIYLPGEFGVRIEDLILVTDDGYENLNHFPKDLIVI